MMTVCVVEVTPRRNSAGAAHPGAEEDDDDDDESENVNPPQGSIYGSVRACVIHVDSGVMLSHVPSCG